MDETQLLKDTAAKNSLSYEAVLCLWDALKRGNGSMAQFSHSELGGSGQWMSGGMVMLQNMFDLSLKAKVDQVCNELSNAAAEAARSQPRAATGGGSQHQWQSSGGHGSWSQSSSSGWWPAELGQPSSSGSQNQLRYAVFPEAKRLAISDGNSIRIYDTGDHRIGGVSQQQGGGESVLFQSDRGRVELSQLREVTQTGEHRDRSASGSENTSDAAVPEGPEAVAIRGEAASELPAVPPQPHADAATAGGTSLDPIDALERLAKLHRAGIVTDEEFSAKKAELLRRL